jgi:hypothetical protein
LLAFASLTVSKLPLISQEWVTISRNTPLCFSEVVALKTSVFDTPSFAEFWTAPVSKLAGKVAANMETSVQRPPKSNNAKLKSQNAKLRHRYEVIVLSFEFKVLT